ncbi:MAG: hypothetical protein HFJ19_06175 [Clostridia bacterium]|nr:hypothetical protein [Clostridia bacterium]
MYIYSSIEELHLEVFGEKREEWGVCCGDGNNALKIVSPANPGKIHDYKTMLKILSKCVADLILEDNFPNVPKWFDITTYITELSTEEYTYSKPSIIKLKNENYFNYSDSYFIARYIAETFGKDIVLKILKNSDKYNEILEMSDEEIDAKIEKYYAKGD